MTVAVRFKWDEDLLAEGFTPFPKKLIRCIYRIFGGSLAFEHLAVVLAVVDYRRPNLTREPSLGFLSFNTGLSASTVMDCLHDLQQEGLLTISGDEEALSINPEKLCDRIRKEIAQEPPDAMQAGDS